MRGQHTTRRRRLRATALRGTGRRGDHMGVSVARAPWAAAALLLLILPSLAAAAQAAATVVVRSDGTVEAIIRAGAAPGLNAYPAPAPPLPATILAEVDGQAVPVVYDNGTIYVATDKPANVTITYLVNVTMHDGYAEFSLGEGRVLLRLEPGVVLLNLPEGILDVKQLPDGSLEVLLEGPSVVRYTVARLPAQTATETATAAPQQTTTATETAQTQPAATTTPAQTGAAGTQATETGGTAATPSPAATETAAGTAPAETAGGQQPAAATTSGGGGGFPVAAAALLAVAAAGGAVLLLRGRRGAAAAPVGGPGGPGGGGAESAVTVQPRGLDDVDRRILEKLREHGGSMLQSQLLRETGLPKTTLWRHVQKLEKMGYIEVVREGRSNRLVLKRDEG